MGTKKTGSFVNGLAGQLRCPLCEPRNLAAGRVFVNHAFAGAPHQLRLRDLQGFKGRLLVSSRQRLFHLPREGADAALAGMVARRAFCILAHALLGGGDIRHWASRPDWKGGGS